MTEAESEATAHEAVLGPHADSRRGWLAFAALALLLLGLAAGLGISAVPRGDEATYLSMVMSLRHDRDLRFGAEDLHRAFRVWPDGPRGVALVSDDGGRTVYYDRPLLYPLAALPAYLLLGSRGLAVFNMLLYLLMVTVAWRSLKKNQPGGGAGDKPDGGAGDPPGGGAGALLLAGFFFFAAASFTRVFYGEPVVWTMTALFLALALWRRIRRRSGPQQVAALAMGGLGAAAWSHEPLLALLAIPIAADLAARRRYPPLAAFLLAALLGTGLFAGLERWAPGRPPASATTQAAVFQELFPAGEGSEDAWSRGLEEAPREEGGPEGEEPDGGIGGLARRAGVFLAGRHLGLLPYYPFALFFLLAGLLGTIRDGSRLLLLLTLVACCLVWIAQGLRPEGVLDTPGHGPFALLYPAFFWLLGPVRVRGAWLLPFAAAGLWTAPAVVATLPGPTAAGPWEPARVAAFRWLPLELDLVVAGALPEYVAYARDDQRWWLPVADFFVQEGHPSGVWVRGASSPEVVVAAPRRLDELRFRVDSLAPDNRLRLESEAGSVVVRFDSPAKQWGTEIRLPVEPAVRPGLFLYPFRLWVEDGRVARYALPDSRDPRYLGVFLDLTGGGL